MLRCLLDSIKEYEVTDKVVDKTLGNSELELVNLIKKNKSITIPEMMQKTGLSDSGVRKILSGLKKKGVIERVGANKNGYWKL